MKDKKTFVVTLRSDIRNMATIHHMLKEHSLHPTSASALTSMALNLLGQLAESKNFPCYASTAEAYNYLEQEGVIGPMGTQRNYKTLLKTLSEEDVSEDSTPSPSSIPQGIAEDIKEVVERRAKELREAQRSLSKIPEGMIREENEEDDEN